MRHVRVVSVFPVGRAWKVSCDDQLVEFSFADLGTAIDAASALCDDGPVRIVLLDRAAAAARVAAARATAA